MKMTSSTALAASAAAAATHAMTSSSSSSLMPRMGLGMAALGRPGYINLNRSVIFDNDGENKDGADGTDRSIDKMKSQSFKVLDALFEQQRQQQQQTFQPSTSKSSSSSSTSPLKTKPWIDCARSYGLSEQFVGEHLRNNNISPDDVYVSSKWGYTYVADWKVQLDDGKPHEVKDHSVSNFLKQIEESSEFLGEYIDLYQIHSATFESGVMDDPDVHEALVQCRSDKGWSIGLSVSSPQQDQVIRRAMNLQVEQPDGTKVHVFDSVQCTYNVLEQRPGPALLEAFHQSRMNTIIIKEGLANGRVLHHPVIVEYSKKLSCQPDQLALACILAQPFEPHVLSGAVTPEQLQSNLKAMDVADTLRSNDGVLLDEIMSKTIMDSDEYWTERSNLSWN